MVLKIPSTKNQYGLDTPYFVRWLNHIIPSLDRFKPDEFAREFGRMAAAADKEALLADQLTPSARAKSCHWVQQYPDEESSWVSSCGVTYTFTNGDPEDNGHKYCHKCGKPLIVDDREADEESEE